MTKDIDFAISFDTIGIDRFIIGWLLAMIFDNHKALVDSYRLFDTAVIKRRESNVL